MQIRFVCAGLLVMVVLHPCRAGQLTPPPGPVVPTAKPLAEIEPRTAISPENTPGDADSVFRIQMPGSYYLTANVTADPGKHGIKIASSDVTIDLNGFALLGVPGALNGIATEDGSTRIVIRDGVVQGWDGDGVRTASVGGNGFLLEGLITSNNGGFGIVVGNRSVVRGCSSFENQGGGIIVGSYSVLEGSTASSNQSTGLIVGSFSTVRGCVSYENFVGYTIGMRSVVVHCVSAHSQSTGFSLGGDSRIAHCVASDDDGIGIRAGSGTSVSHCSMSRCGGGILGIFLGIESCVIRQSIAVGIDVGNGINATQSLIQNCYITGCFGAGITGVKCTIVGNMLERNAGGQIRQFDWCSIRENVCIGDGELSPGIVLAQTNKAVVERNVIVDGSIGIQVIGIQNLILSNRVSTTGTSYDIPNNNTWGPIIDVSFAEDISAVPGADHPMANYVY